MIHKLGLDANAVHFLVNSMEAVIIEARNDGRRGSVACVKNVSFNRAAAHATLTIGIGVCDWREKFSSGVTGVLRRVAKKIRISSEHLRVWQECVSHELPPLQSATLNSPDEGNIWAEVIIDFGNPVVSDSEMSGGSSVCSQLAVVLAEVSDAEDNVVADPTFKSSATVALRSSPVLTRASTAAKDSKMELVAVSAPVVKEEAVLFADSVLSEDLLPMELDPRLALPSLSPPLPVPDLPVFPPAVPELVLDAVEWQDFDWLNQCI
mmetsp:Transcript_2198/g.4016  ORF Transcript_2198/g.4016 Transcript_2198/m.4016 type:complete len:265 (+) Transcript_2198:569-1363(+)